MRVKVGINGFGTIGKRVAEAVAKQDDMEVVGVVKTRPDYIAKLAVEKGFKLYTVSESLDKFEKAGFKVEGTVEDLLRKVDVIVDATPKGYGAKYKPLYEKYSVKAVFQGGEKHSIVEVSFNALANYREVLGKNYVRVVSCNTTGLLRVLSTLDKSFKIRKVRALIVRRATDPMDVKRGPVNAIVLDPPTIPSHHGGDVKTVMPWLNIETAALIVPTTLMHVHYLNIELEAKPTREDIIRVLEETPRIKLLSCEKTGITSTAQIIELARDLGRARYDIPELIIWEDSIKVHNGEVQLFQAVHQESIVVPENVDAIRAMFKLEVDPIKSIRKTDEKLGIVGGRFE